MNDEIDTSADIARETALVDLVKLDYDAALRAVNGFTTAGAQLRSIGIGAWAIVLGIGVETESAALAALALLLTLLFGYADAYHAALYRRALSRAIRLEDLLDQYVNRLGIDADDEDAVLEFQARLETHRFGMYRALRQPRLREYVNGRPREVFRIIYPALILASLVAIAWFF